MHWRTQDVRHGAAVDDASGAHDNDVIGQRGDHAHVVGDHDQCHAALVDELAQQGQQLRLHGHVEGGRGLVRDQQVRAAGQCHRDHHPLPHAARQFVRILRQPPCNVVHTHRVEQARGLRPGFGLPHAAMQAQRFAYLLADAQVWRQ